MGGGIITKKKIGDIVSVQGGYAFKSKHFVKEGIPIVRISDLTTEKLNLEKCAKYPFDANVDFEKYLISEGDILIAMSGATTGKIGIAKGVKDKIVLNQRVGNFKILNSNELDKTFLYYLVKSDKYQKEIARLAAGCAQPNISAKKLESISVDFPKLDLQKKYASTLMKIDSLIHYRLQSIILVNEYMKNLFHEFFGDISVNDKNWDIENLEDIISFNTKSKKPEEFKNDSIYVGLEHIESDKGKFINLKPIANYNIKSNKYEFNEKMVLYGKLRPYLNKVAIPSFSGVCSTDILPLLPNEKSNKYYIKFLLSTKHYVNLATEKSSGANLPRIAPKALKKFEVPVPPIDLQNKFESVIKKVYNIEKYQIESKQELEKLLKFKSNKIFNGV